jgi:hypothetical protein
MAAVSTIIGGAGLALSAGSAIANADAQRKSAHAAQDAANAANDPTKNGSVNIADLDAQARDFAKRNAADSRALEDQYNPGASALRANSLAALNGNLGRSAQTQTLADQIAAQAGQAPTGVSYDSPLLRDAIAKAQSQLALGGTLDTETQNAATRHALATAGGVGGGLTLGRDLTARDLGLTSLQLEQQRLTNAANLGGQEAALGQGNASLSLQAQQAGTNNLFNSANFLASLDSGDFARQLSAAQLAQNIAAPASGLDPGSVVNLAVGNSNAKAQGLQQASALQAAQANQKSQLTGQLIGTGLGIAGKYFTPAPAVTTPVAPAASSIPYYGYGY